MAGCITITCKPHGLSNLDLRKQQFSLMTRNSDYNTIASMHMYACMYIIGSTHSVNGFLKGSDFIQEIYSHGQEFNQGPSTHIESNIAASGLFHLLLHVNYRKNNDNLKLPALTSTKIK